MTTQTTHRRPLPLETSRILGGCRDLAVQRLQGTLSSLLEHAAERLLDRAGDTDIREEQQLFLDARGAIVGQRAALLREFEREMRREFDDRVEGREKAKAAFQKLDISKLAILDANAMEESIVMGNISRVLENLCHDELRTLNHSFGYLLGQPELETEANPLAPGAIVGAITAALRKVIEDGRLNFPVLKEINQGSLGEVNTVYADVNKHLANLHVVPAGLRRAGIQRSHGSDRPGAGGADTAPAEEADKAAPSSEVDLMALFSRRFGGAAPSLPAHPRGPGGGPSGEMPYAASPWIPQGPLRPTPSGYTPGAPIIATPALGEGLSRLQKGEYGFDLGDGALIQFAAVPEGMQNVLRDLQESPLGKKTTQLEAMTIELVAMLFDFIFETKDLPDGIKALLARLQIPVLKAAMLDSAFFAKKSHPSRLLVNALAEAGRGWSPEMGVDDPLYRRIEEIVHRVLDGFTDDLAIFDDLRETLARFLADEEAAAEANIRSTADEIQESDLLQSSVVVAKAEIERRIAGSPVPHFLADFLRQRWRGALARIYAQDGEESAAWSDGLATLEDLIWSVQPKRSSGDRKHLVALLPSLLKRMADGLRAEPWDAAERERFMSNLVEAHAAAVKPSLVSVPLPTAVVAEQAKARAAEAKAAGDEAAAAKAEALAVAMAPAQPLEPEPGEEIIEDHFLAIAQSVERGMWIEFEAEDGQLVFAKLAWVSPLRGTYLFTNRQGQKALSMTAEELAQRFRSDKARLVEAEPLVDRAFTSVLSQFDGRAAAVAA